MNKQTRDILMLEKFGNTEETPIKEDSSSHKKSIEHKIVKTISDFHDSLEHSSSDEDSSNESSKMVNTKKQKIENQR